MKEAGEFYENKITFKALLSFISFKSAICHIKSRNKMAEEHNLRRMKHKFIFILKGNVAMRNEGKKDAI